MSLVTSAATTRLSGDVMDVASFFCVSARTVLDWNKEKPPRITFFQDGRNICYGEEAVIEYRVKKTLNARRVLPGEAEEVARREWREHLKVRSAECGVRNLEGRVARLENLIAGALGHPLLGERAGVRAVRNTQQAAETHNPERQAA